MFASFSIMSIGRGGRGEEAIQREISGVRSCVGRMILENACNPDFKILNNLYTYFVAVNFEKYLFIDHYKTQNLPFVCVFWINIAGTLH